ncbi:MAG: o-succinylbenzoate synthase [Rhodothermales bacterium]
MSTSISPFHLKRITLREIHLPLVEPFAISSGTETVRRITLVEMEDGDGVTAWGECVAAALPNYNSESVDTAWMAMSQWLAPLLLGKTVQPLEVYDLFHKAMRGHEMAKAGLEMTLWGLAATRQGVALARLLGGTRAEVGTGISIGIQATPEKLVKKVGECMAQGYRKIKMKIKPGFDIPYVRAVRDAYGDSAPLMVDANNAYTLEDVEVLKQLDAFGLIMIEQPLEWDDLVRHAALQPQLQTPICLDESITKLERAQDMVTLGSGRIINIKPGRVAGYTSSLRIHDYTQRQGIPVWCGGMLESGIGRAYNVALASLPNFTLPGDISPSRRYWERDIVSPEWEMDQAGMIAVPMDTPGIGVEVDVDRIDNLTVRELTI